MFNQVGGPQQLPGMQQPPDMMGAPMGGAPGMPGGSMPGQPPQEMDPNALLAALMGGNDALGNNLLALFQARQQNPNAVGDVFSPYQQPQAPASPMMPGLPF